MRNDIVRDAADVRLTSLQCENGTSLFVAERPVTSAIADVVFATPYGKSVPNLFVFAHAFAANGFGTTRFDLRNHVGRSSGEPRDFRPSQIEDDLARVLERRAIRATEVPLILVAMSLSLPAALRVAARFPVAGIVSIVGVVDLPDTAGKILDWPDFRAKAETYADGEVVPVFGYDLLVRRFLADMDERGYSSGLPGTLDDLAKLDIPVHLIAGEADEYVDIAAVREVARHLPNRGSLTVLDGMTHELGRSIVLTKHVLRASVRAALDIVGSSREALVPALTDAVRASAHESSLLSASAGVEDR
jgi:pimeloyl-ACP methyl ester carboxylesterase